MSENERAIAVGEFSRLTHLPVKTLHHYHDVGVLVPVLVDPVTGYRRYAPGQVASAHLARRLRELRMPLARMRSVLAAPDIPSRDAGIAAYLDQLQRELTQTAAAVAALRKLLHSNADPGVTYRRWAAQPALALVADVDREQIGPWCGRVFPRLLAALGPESAVPVGAGGALYEPGWFENDGGRVTAYLPIADVPIADRKAVDLETADLETEVEPDPRPDRVYRTTIPAARLAVAVHAGPYRELDLTYGVLGRHVLDRGIGAAGPIRELYLVSPGDTDDESGMRTEVCWPIIDFEEHP